jgi:hypothetical protein
MDGRNVGLGVARASCIASAIACQRGAVMVFEHDCRLVLRGNCEKVDA